MIYLNPGISIETCIVGGSHHHSVFCVQTVIPKNTRYGPFTGRIVHPSEIKANDDTNFMWEVGTILLK